MTPSLEVLRELPPLPRDEAGPVFREPWQAHAFALAVRLAEAGCFTWPEWAAMLSREIHTAQAQDVGEDYYRHWLNALEKICAEKGIVKIEAMHERKEDWRHAYLHTPHGQPVELASGGRKPPD